MELTRLVFPFQGSGKSNSGQIRADRCWGFEIEFTTRGFLKVTSEFMVGSVAEWADSTWYHLIPQLIWLIDGINGLSTLPWGFQCVLVWRPTSYKSVLISCWLTRSELAQSGWNLAGHERAHNRSRCHHLQFGCLLEIQICFQCVQPGLFWITVYSDTIFGDMIFQFGWRQNLDQWSIQLWWSLCCCGIMYTAA